MKDFHSWPQSIPLKTQNSFAFKDLFKNKIFAVAYFFQSDNYENFIDSTVPTCDILDSIYKCEIEGF
jgi:hypothetical protein